MLTPGEDADDRLTYDARVIFNPGSAEEVVVTACNHTSDLIPDGTSHFSLLVIHAQ